MILDLAIDNRVLIKNKYDAYVQELDLIFNTYKTELIGDSNFGTDFEQFLWTLNPDEAEIERYVSNIISNCAYFNYFPTSIEVHYEEGEERAIYIIIIAITTNDGVKNKVYQFQ